MLNRLPGRPARPGGGLMLPPRPLGLGRRGSPLSPLGLRAPVRPGRFSSEPAVPELATVISSGASASVATLDIPVDGDTWDMVEVHLWNLRPATDNVALHARFSQGGSFLAGADDYSWILASNGSATADASDSEIQITSAQGNAAGELSWFTFRLLRPTASSFAKALIWHGAFTITTGVILDSTGTGKFVESDAAIEDIRFLFSSGDIAEAFHYALGWKFS